MIEDNINKLIDNCNLGEIVEKPVRVFGGLLNRMYRVKTTSGEYAIKHLNPEVMKRKNAKQNHITAETIARIAKENGICSIPAKKINNNVIQEIDGNHFLIYDWVLGKAISNTEITNDHVKKVAEILAKIHNTDFGIIKDKCIIESNINEVNWDLYISKMENQEIKQLLIDRKDELIELDKKSTENVLKMNDNMVVSHRDLDLPNILWDDNNIPVIIDWESSGMVNPYEEVVETAWDWSGGQEFFDMEKFKLFLYTYKNNNRDLKDLDKAIYSNFKNKSGWLEYNLKRVCKIECIDEEEQRLGEKEVIRVISEIFKFYEIMRRFKYDIN